MEIGDRHVTQVTQTTIWLDIAEMFGRQDNVGCGCVVFFPGGSPMTDGQIQAKAIICAALIQSRTFDSDALGSANKSISDHNLTHLTAVPTRKSIRSPIGRCRPVTFVLPSADADGLARVNGHVKPVAAHWPSAVASGIQPIRRSMSASVNGASSTIRSAAR
jgi:hypothetical protein